MKSFNPKENSFHFLAKFWQFNWQSKKKEAHGLGKKKGRCTAFICVAAALKSKIKTYTRYTII